MHAGQLGSVPSRGNEGIFFFVTASRLALVLPVQWVLRAPSSGLKQLGHEADH